MDPRRPVADVDRIAYELRRITDRLDTLEAPSGTQAYRAVEKLTAIVEDIQAQIDAWAAGRWTNAQIDARILALIASHMAGNVSIGGALTVQGTVTLPGARGTDLTSAANRTTAWLAGPTDNRLGHT